MPSVQSRVTNILPYMNDKSVTLAQFWEALREHMFRENGMEWYRLTPQDLAGVQKLHDDIYATWDWNYGASPAYTVQKSRRFEGRGKLEAYIDVNSNGLVNDVIFYGDYFGNGDSRELAALLKGRAMEEATLRQALAGVDIAHSFAGLGQDDFMDVLLR